ncbi:MAG TPA: 3-deoxy-7-phosphoheptulonate synthase [Polyangia bacterium]|jgi:3-deoxy-7-phosphoheptulonate synthase
MIIVLRPGATPAEAAAVVRFVEEAGYTAHRSDGQAQTVIGVVGALPTGLDLRPFEVLPGVARVLRITAPYKLAGRHFRADDTVIDLGGVVVGGREVVLMAGPCAVENRDQIRAVAASVKAAGAKVLRGGAFKPRSSPYSFQGLGQEGLELLRQAADEHGLKVISEVMDRSQVDAMADLVDIFQVGARNMQNFDLLRDLGHVARPVMLKRGLAATLEELLLAAEYVMSGGNHRVILCERGIRTFERATRNTLDISAIPVLKTLSHLPVVVDPSHATGVRDKVIPVARAAVAAGADGLLVEVHCDPDHALSDGAQSLFPDQFTTLARQTRAIAEVIGRSQAGG